MRVLSYSQQPMGVTELSQVLGCGKSTVHLLLKTLAGEDFVERASNSSKYRLGLGLFEMGAAAVEQVGYGLRLSPPMERLATETGEAVSFAVRSGDSAIVLQRFESVHVLRTDIRPGTRMPLHGSASGKVLLADMSDEVIDSLYPAGELPPLASRTIRTKSALKTELNRVRECGWATSTNEYVDGVAATAAGVRDQTGRVVGALSVAGPTTRFDVQRWADRLLQVAAEVSKLLGHIAALVASSDSRSADGSRGRHRDPIGRALVSE
jgi:DNA-binding IclR family transcriptional regulator